MHNALIEAIRELGDSHISVNVGEYEKGYNTGLDRGISAVKSLGDQIVPIQTVQALLKETYLEVSDCDISDLSSDTDKTAVIASKFRQTMLNKMAQVNEETPSTVKVVGESETKVFPIRIRCQRVENGEGLAYGKAIDFCGRELEIEQHDVKKHKWFKYPNSSGQDYGVICPICKQFVVIDEEKLPQYVKAAAEEILLN